MERAQLAVDLADAAYCVGVRHLLVLVLGGCPPSLRRAQAHLDAWNGQLEHLGAGADVLRLDWSASDGNAAGDAGAAAAQGLDLEEAQAHRITSIYQSDDAMALKHLQEAEQALAHKGNATEADVLQEKAIILRYRAVRADRAGNAEVASKTMQQLEAIAGGSRSYIVQGAYHGAMGAMLMRKEKVDEAIAHLEEDQENPFSLELLARAYQMRGDSEKRHEVEVKLRSLNVPTVEQAMVVPEVRAQRPTGE